MSSLPIITGFYPDPSITRAGDTYYIVNSSFEYLPGLPIHSSTDLLTWTPVTNALARPTQIAEHSGEPSGGVYAPTIRHHDGRFWIVGTNLPDLGLGLGHFIISADDPAGPWSDPAHVTGTVGIDPDLMWDDEGVCRLTWASFSPALRGIASAPVDPRSGELLGEPALLWQGTGLAHGEGPHLYQISGWWYLLLAEGGTERGHTSTVARARSLEGPWEEAPTNPVLTHRSTADPVQSVGHADLVELADGRWAAVHLGTRPRGKTPSFHVNGRETFIVGIDWVDGWPVVDESRFTVPAVDHSFVDHFDSPSLHQRWLGAGRFPAAFTTDVGGEGLAIEAGIPPIGKSILATRVRDVEWTADVRLDADAGIGRFSVRIDDRHSYGLRFTGESVEAELAIGPVVHVVGRESVKRGASPLLRLSARLPESGPYFAPDQPDLIRLALVHPDGREVVFGAFDGRYVSTEVATGFTGRVLGVEALAGRIVVNTFTYTSNGDR